MATLRITLSTPEASGRPAELVWVHDQPFTLYLQAVSRKGPAAPSTEPLFSTHASTRASPSSPPVPVPTSVWPWGVPEQSQPCLHTCDHLRTFTSS